MHAVEPLEYGATGQPVADLHEALDLLAVGESISDAERIEHRYGDGTAEAVAHVQTQHRISDSSPRRFDDECAAVVNRLLSDRGAPTAPAATAEKTPKTTPPRARAPKAAKATRRRRSSAAASARGVDDERSADPGAIHGTPTAAGPDADDARGGWNQIQLPDSMAAEASAITALSRRSGHLEAWWFGRHDDRVHGAYLYDGESDDWAEYELRRQFVAASRGSALTSLSRGQNHMEVWWISQFGQVLGAFRLDDHDWDPYTVLPAGPPNSATPTSGIASLSRSADHMEVWWIAPGGWVHGAWWTEAEPTWHYREQPADAGGDGARASETGGIAAVSRTATTMDLLWIGREGQVHHAPWDQDEGGWRTPFKDAAGQHKAALSHSIAAVALTESTVDAVWITESGTIRGARWTDGDAAWVSYQTPLAEDGSASKTGGIAAVKRTNTSFDVVWITERGAVRGATRTDNGWQSYQVAGDGSASPTSGITATSRPSTTAQVWWVAPGGAVQIAVRNDDSGSDWLVHGVIRNDGRPYQKPLRVRAFDADNVGGQALGVHATADGTYSIVYRRPRPASGECADVEMAGDFSLVVAAYTADERQVARSSARPNPGRTEEIDLDVTDLTPPRKVRGAVVDTKGRPVAGVVVKVLDRDIGTARDLLGVSESGADGAFWVQYQKDDFKRGDADTRGEVESPRADVVFDLQRDGVTVNKFSIQRLPVGATDVITAPLPVPDEELILGIVARDDELVRIELTEITGTPGLSEYVRVIAALDKITSREDIVKFDQAVHRDITFAARETGVEYVLIDAMVAAHKLQKVLGPSVAQQPCYGVVKHAGARTANAVAAFSIAELTGHMHAAVAADTIDRLASPGDVAAALHRAAIEAALKPDPGNFTVTTPLNHAINDPGVRARVLAILSDPPGGDVWEYIGDNFDPAQVDVGQLQYSLQLGALLSSQVDDNKALFAEIIKKTPMIKTMAALVRHLTYDTLTEAIKDAGALPDDIVDNETHDQARARMAGSLRRLMDAAHPTAAVARTFAEINASSRELVDDATIAALDGLADKNVDLATARLSEAIEDDPDILGGLRSDAQRAQALDGAQRAQRLFRISGDATDLKLIASARDAAGKPFGGAVDIARLGKPRFLALFPATTPQSQVAALDLIHRRAQTLSDSLAHLAIADHQDNRPDQIRSAASGLLQPEETDASQRRARTSPWQDIFGSEERCECDECRSVVGPAAYLVDLFEFLDKRCTPGPGANGVTLLDHLIGHPTKKDEQGQPITGLRPDLAHIKLTCHNVNTTMPFIDVINQILESVIANDGTIVPLADPDPTVTGAQLSAAPIRIIEKAYEELAKAFYPIGLPYDRRLDTARTWMRQAGDARADALRVFRKSPDAVAAETLGLYRRDWEILTDTGLGGGAPQTPTPTATQLYGVSALSDLTNTRKVLEALSITYEFLVEVLRTTFIGGLVPDADDSGTAARILLNLDQLQTLRDADYQTTDPTIKQLLERGGISGEDVRKFDAAHQPKTIVLDPPDSCDPAIVRLRHLDGTALDAPAWLKIHKLVRLSTRSGITPAHLDVALSAVGSAATITVGALHSLYELARLRALLAVDWPRAAAVVSEIGTVGRDNLYDELFIDSGISQVHPVLGRGPRGVLLQGQPVPLTSIASAIVTVLQWDPEDLEEIAADLTITQVRLADLSTLHRIGILARTLGISPPETHRLHRLLQVPDSTAGTTVRFVERATRIIGLQIGMSAVEALVHEPATASADDRTVVDAKTARKALEVGLIADQDTAKPEEAGKLVVDIVAKVFGLDSGSAKDLVQAGSTLAALRFNPAGPQLDSAEIELRRVARLAEVIRSLGGAGPYLCQSLGRADRSAAQSLTAIVGSATDAVRREVLDDIARFADLVRRVGRPEQLKDAATTALSGSTGLDSSIAAWLSVSETRVRAVRDSYGQSNPVPLQYLDDLSGINRTATRFGIEPHQVGRALLEPVTQADVEVLLTGVASHYSSSAWLELSRQLTDPIRERSRDALVAYIKRRDGIDDDNDLFGHYLVDVGRDSFVLTSPIQQATFAVQTFVQRCQLGMYAPVKPNQVNGDEWVVEGSYPVWASRMMTFLWPEHILNAAWRDNKSPNFVELENSLRQSDVTEANTRKALEQYVESMGVTSSLEICGTHRQDKFTGAEAARFHSVLHIVGRTRTSPRRYFYRRLETYQHHEEWTDWEPITTEIDGVEQDRTEGRQQETNAPLPVPGVHVLPVTWKGAVHVFWARFVRKVDTPNSPPRIEIDSQGRFSEPYWEIKLSYTRRDPAGWTPKEQWPAIVETWDPRPPPVGAGPSFPPTDSLLLHASKVTDDVLEISVGTRRGKRMDENLYGDMVQTWLHYRFEAAGPYGRVISDHISPFLLDTGGTVNRVLPGGDHPAFKGDVAGDYQAISVSGDLNAVAAWDNLDGDRLFTASAPLRMTCLNQGYKGSSVPLLLDLDDNVYFATTHPGTTSIDDPALDSGGDNAAAVKLLRDTVLDSVNHALAGPAVIDAAKNRHLTLIRAATQDQLVSVVKSTAPQLIKVHNPWINSKALVVATTDFTRPPAEVDVAATETVQPGYWYGGTWGSWGLGELWNLTRTKSIPAVDLEVIAFSNPFVNRYNVALRTGGLDALYDPARQQETLAPTRTFKFRCEPDPQRVTAPDTEGVEFGINAPCGRQHWELFFHIPALVQDLQRESKQLDAALATIRRIYDPMSPVADPKDVWRFKPFRDAKPVRVEELLEKLTLPPDNTERKEVEAQLEQMRLFPFQGHRIARLRPIAYKRWLVMELVRLLIELTDRGIRAFTPEKVNESFLYCLAAAAIMGPAPQRVRPRAAMTPRSYAELRVLLDSSSDALLSAETELGSQPVASAAAAPSPGAAGNMARCAAIGYFGIPRDQKLHALWDLVDDRLYKLRHGMNLDGVRVQLPLFLPPIDPAVLAQAVGSGVRLDEALEMLAAPRPPYRFVVAHREAVAAAQNLITLGEALLQAYIQRDAESLARLTAAQQKDMAQQVLDSRDRAVEMAEAELADAEQQRDTHLQLWRHYRELLGLTLSEPGADTTGYAAAQRQLKLVPSSSVNFAALQVIPDIAKGVAFLASPAAAAGLALIDAGAAGVTMAPGMMLAEEKQELESSFEAVKLSFDAALLETLAGALGLIPTFEGAVKPLGAGAAVHFGGAALAAAARAAAGNKNTVGRMHRFLAQVYDKQAGLVLRERDWILGLNQAAAHVHEVDKRIAVAKLRIDCCPSLSVTMLSSSVVMMTDR